MAEGRVGKLLGEQITKGGDPKSHDVTLEDLDITKTQSSRWQVGLKKRSGSQWGLRDQELAKL